MTDYSCKTTEWKYQPSILTPTPHHLHFEIKQSFHVHYYSSWHTVFLDLLESRLRFIQRTVNALVMLLYIPYTLSSVFGAW